MSLGNSSSGKLRWYPRNLTSWNQTQQRQIHSQKFLKTSLKRTQYKILDMDKILQEGLIIFGVELEFNTDWASGAEVDWFDLILVSRKSGSDVDVMSS